MDTGRQVIHGIGCTVYGLMFIWLAIVAGEAVIALLGVAAIAMGAKTVYAAANPSVEMMWIETLESALRPHDLHLSGDLARGDLSILSLGSDTEPVRATRDRPDRVVLTCSAPALAAVSISPGEPDGPLLGLSIPAMSTIDALHLLTPAIRASLFAVLDDGATVAHGEVVLSVPVDAVSAESVSAMGMLGGTKPFTAPVAHSKRRRRALDARRIELMMSDPDPVWRSAWLAALRDIAARRPKGGRRLIQAMRTAIVTGAHPDLALELILRGGARVGLGALLATFSRLPGDADVEALMRAIVTRLRRAERVDAPAPDDPSGVPMLVAIADAAPRTRPAVARHLPELGMDVAQVVAGWFEGIGPVVAAQLVHHLAEDPTQAGLRALVAWRTSHAADGHAVPDTITRAERQMRSVLMDGRVGGLEIVSTAGAGRLSLGGERTD